MASAATPSDELLQYINAYRAQPSGCSITQKAPAIVRNKRWDAAATAYLGGADPFDLLPDARGAHSMWISGYTNTQDAFQALRKNYCKELLQTDANAIGLAVQGKKWAIVIGKRALLLSEVDSAGYAAEVLRLTNIARTKGYVCGNTRYPAVPALVLQSQLNQAAQYHAQDMVNRNYFNHRNPDGLKVGDRATRFGYNWRSIGENIAAGQATPAEVVDGWLKSPGHCANIMSANFKELGVAFGAKDGLAYTWVQVFGAR